MKIPPAIAGVVASLTEPEKQALEDWLNDLLRIRSSQISRWGKLKEVSRNLQQSKSLWPIIRHLARATKRHGWDDRKFGSRGFVVGASFAILFVGFQGAGIAALGGAIGLPLWIVMGTGGAAAGSLIEELSARKKEDGSLPREGKTNQNTEPE